MAATTIRDRMARLGGASLARRLVIVGALVALALAVFVLTNAGEEPGGEEAGMEGDTAVDQATESVDGQGGEPDGIGGAADPGVFADAPTPLEEGSTPNATSATQGDEMLDRPADPPGGGRVDPGGDQTAAGEIAEQEEVPKRVRESDVRTALPDDETGEGAADEADGGSVSGSATVEGEGSASAADEATGATGGMAGGDAEKTQAQSP
ncbi:MAG: hypothetical protein V2I65_14185 [Paracoccaceae bacterium]|nr:hypothetical protein [Paracoccaceae bacterium]